VGHVLPRAFEGCRATLNLARVPFFRASQRTQVVPSLRTAPAAWPAGRGKSRVPRGQITWKAGSRCAHMGLLFLGAVAGISHDGLWGGSRTQGVAKQCPVLSSKGVRLMHLLSVL
jgi:hypothetical protein